MPTQYLLLPTFRYEEPWEGLWYQLGERARWEFSLQVSRLSTDGSVTVEVQTSPWTSGEDWKPLVTFPPQSLVGLTTLRAAEAGFKVVPKQDVWIRAVITNLVGNAIVECRGVAPFFDIGDETHWSLCSQELREWKDGKERMVMQAESEVMNLLMLDVTTGELDIDLELPGATEAVRLEIALQAEHNRRRDILARSGDAASLKALKEMTRGIPGFGDSLKKFRSKSSTVWLGR